MKTKKLLTWVAAATMLVGLASCNEPAPAPEPEPEPVVTLSSIEVTELPNRVNYFVGEKFDSDGLEVTAKYSDKSSKVLEESKYTMDLEDGYEFTEADTGYKRVTVTYQEKMDYFTIKIEKAQLTGIELKTNEVKYLYEKGDEFDPNGLTVYALYNNGDKVELDEEDYVVHAPDMNVYGEQQVYVDYKGYRDSFPIRVREAYWYEEFEAMFASLGIDFDLPGEFLMEISEEVFGYATIDLVTYSGLDYFELHFDEFNTGISAWLALYLGVNYAMEPTNFALVDFNYDSYNMEDDTGYMYWEVYSEIGSEGYYVDFYCDGNNNFGSYEDEFRFLIGIREAFTAEETAKVLNAALYGSDSIANIEDVSEYGLEPVDAEALEEVSPYFILDAETTYSEAAAEEEEALVEYLLQLPNAEDYSDYASSYDCDAIVVAEFDTDLYSVESLAKVLAVVFEADLGLEFVLGPAQDEDGDYYGVALTPDQAIAIEFVCFEDDGELLTNFFVYMTDAAYTTFTSLDVMLPGVDAKEDLLEVFNPTLFDKYTLWEAQFGDFAVSTFDNEGIVVFAQIMGYPKEEYGEKQNYTNINLFPYYQIYETQEVIEEGVNTFFEMFGFATQFADFSSFMPYVMFQGSIEARAMSLQIFDNHDPMYDPHYDPDGSYDGDSLEDLVLALFKDNDAWELDMSQYDTKGYIARSKETFAVLPGERPSQIMVNFFTYKYQFKMAIQLVPVTQTVPVEAINASIDAFYSDVEGASAALGLAAFAESLNGERFIVDHSIGFEDESWKLSSEEISEDSYDAIIAWAGELLASEEWTANVSKIPGYCSSELVFTNKTTGMIVRLYYDYNMDIDWDALTISYTYFVDYIKIEMTKNPVEPVQLSFSETLASYAEVDGVDLGGLDYTGFDALEGVTMSTEVKYSGNFPYGQAKLELNEDATGEQMDAFYNQLVAFMNAIQADYEANPDKYYSVSNYNGKYSAPEGYESIYYIVKIADATGDDYATSIVLSFDNYDMDIVVTCYGNFVEPAEPVAPTAGSTLQAIYNEYIKVWAEELNMADPDDFDASYIPAFEWEILEVNEEIEDGLGFGDITFKTVARSPYQNQLLLSGLIKSLEDIGLELYGIQQGDNGSITIIYRKAFEGYEYMWIEADITITPNGDGTYTYTMLMGFVSFGF